MHLRFGAFTFDAQARELRRDGDVAPLSPKAMRLLELLIDAHPNTVPHEKLYAELWPDVVVEPGNLHGLVNEIRSAIAHDAIRTVHRVGYAFTATTTSENVFRFSIFMGDEEIPLRSGANSIGRGFQNLIVVQSPEVSRYHARITIKGPRAILEDLNSTHGTFLGTRRIAGPTEIQSGDEILVGTTKLRFMHIPPDESTI